MALNAADLTSGLVDAFSTEHESTKDAADAWAAAFTSFATAIVPPSTAVTAAGEALAGGLKTAFDAQAVDTEAFVALLLPHLNTWVSAIGLGMAPAYTPFVPPVVANIKDPLTSTFSSNNAPGITNEVAATLIAAIFPPWMITGTATLAVSPFTVTPWS